MNEAHGAKTEGITMKKTWKQMKIESMQHNYGHHIEEFKGHKDDRLVYVNTYNSIMEALESLPEEPHSYIRVAMFRQLNKDKEVLNDIIYRFCD